MGPSTQFADFFELAVLARRRYPGDPLDEAVMQYHWDRKAAGLGALDEKKRGIAHYGRCNGTVRNSKHRDLLDGRVRYERVIDVPESLRYPEPDWNTWMPGSLAGADTVTLIQVPARRAHLAVKFDARDFQTQRGRKFIAATLHNMRRQTAAAR